MASDNADHERGDGTDGRLSRRGALRGIAALGVGVSVLPGVTSAGSPPGRDVVPEGRAREVARAQVEAASRREEFAAWRDATVGPAVTYHAKNAGKGPSHLPSAYVFSVTKRGEDRGYVTVAARTDWPPVVEYSLADPPRAGRERARAAAERAGGRPSGRAIYQGGVQYGMELDDGRVVNLRNGRVVPNDRGVDLGGIAAGRRLTRDRWDRFDDAGRGASGGGPGGSDGAQAALSTSGSSDRLWWVPAWTEHDAGNADRTSVGSGADAWDRWDGCVPVAASMVVAYHEYVYEWEEEKREKIIDRLHWTMNTSEDGNTYPWDVDDGFDKYDWGWNSYDGRNIYLWTHPNFTISEISDHSRPFLLNMTSGDQAEDRSQNYGDHSVCVVGYRDGGDQLALHDTWDDEVHYLTWGSWLAAMYTKVTTS